MRRRPRREFLIATGALAAAPTFRTATSLLRIVALAACALFAVAPAADAQQPAKVYRVGILTSSPPAGRVYETIRQSLREQGYVEGRNLVLEWRNAEGKAERFDPLAAELARLPVDVIVATTPGYVFAARKATKTIPIVMVNTPDPVQLGLVASLAHPGGNITGTTTLSVDLSAKQLELLKEAFPHVARVAVVWNPSNPWHPLAVRAIESGARALGVQVQALEVRDPADFDKAFAAISRERAGALLVLADPTIAFHRVRIAALAAQHRIPAIYGVREHADAGGLMSYWADSADLYQRTGVYVGRILKGAKPADLPIEQPTRYELVINQKAAKALGVTIPPSVLLRASEVIE